MQLQLPMQFRRPLTPQARARRLIHARWWFEAMRRAADGVNPTLNTQRRKERGQ